MKDFRYTWVIGLIVTALIIVVPIVSFISTEEAVASPWDFVPEEPVHQDHRGLVTGTFETGSDVTRACLSCHDAAAYEVMQTTHWTWQTEPVEVEWSDEPVSTGKANVLNNFCIGIQSNWAGCTRCHTGYGWDDADFDFSQEEQVDCLVCHDQSGGYVKGSAGEPVEGVDLLAVAQSVGSPTRENCGGCHFNGGGGNAVKHGDLDSSLYFPDEEIDVHMGRYDFQCVTCHTAEDHSISGRAISVSVETSNQVSCTDCHTEAVHEDERITDHLDTVTCQACHIPQGATREDTKMFWDWSTAGQDIEEDPHTYLKIKGSFIYEGEFVPSYGWYNGNVERYLIGDTIDPEQTTVLNQPLGGINDETAKIWPFKIHSALQIYDSVNNYLIQPKTVGEGGYWTEFDWDLAAQLGSEAVGLDYSGEYGFAPTEMYWNLSHLVVPSERALQCTDCHGENGRMDWAELGYYGDPMNWGGRDTQGEIVENE